MGTESCLVMVWFGLSAMGTFTNAPFDWSWMRWASNITILLIECLLIVLSAMGTNYYYGRQPTAHGPTAFYIVRR